MLQKKKKKSSDKKKVGEGAMKCYSLEFYSSGLQADVRNNVQIDSKLIYLVFFCLG